MWLCTKYGFFSVVRKAPEEFHVRARARKDLETLLNAVLADEDERLNSGPSEFRKRWPRGLPNIFRSEPADYRYRLVVNDSEWMNLVFLLFLSVDYPNFKGVIASTPDQRDRYEIYADFHHAMEIWQNRRTGLCGVNRRRQSRKPARYQPT